MKLKDRNFDVQSEALLQDTGAEDTQVLWHRGMFQCSGMDEQDDLGQRSKTKTEESMDDVQKRIVMFDRPCPFYQGLVNDIALYFSAF